MSQMVPPPLPGYPQPLPAPPALGVSPGAPGYPAPVGAPPPMPSAGGYPMPAPPAPQGYPGPAVAAPQPPAPMPGQPYPAYAQPPQQAPAGYPPAPAPYGQPNPYGPAPTQQGYAPPPQHSAMGDIGAAIANATGGDRSPKFLQGQYVAEVISTIVTKNPIGGYLTFKAMFKVLQSNNPAVPVGSERAYIEGLQWGAGRAQDFVIAAGGYPNKQVFDQTMAAAGRDPNAELKLLGNAAANPTVAEPGNHYPPNPFAGRRVSVTVSERDQPAGPKSPKAGQMQHITNHVWMPAA